MFDDLNQFATNAEFRIDSFDGARLLLVGGFDLSYPVDIHTVEVAFKEVAFIRCPTYLCEPRFSEAGKTDGGTRFKIEAAEGAFEIIAESVAVAWAKKSDA